MREYESDIITAEREYEPDFFEQDEMTENVSNSYQYKSDTQNKESQYFISESQNYYDIKEKPKKEYDRFEDYSNQQQETSYEEYEVIRNFTPKVKKQKKENKEFNNFLDNQYAYTDSTETYIYQRGKEKSTFSSKTRGRIIVYACAFIAILLSTLCIINLVNISSLNASNQGIQNEISAIDKNLTNAEDSADKIKDEIENNKGDFTEQNSANNVNIPLLEKQTPLTSESQTNFFDKICNFISSIFGG